MPEGMAEYQVQLFLQSVNISEFTITETQMGMAPPTSALQAELTQEFAYVMMEQRRNSRRGFERRQDQRLSQTNQRPSSRPGDRPHRVQFTRNQRRPAVRCSVSPIPLTTTSYHSEGEEPAEEPSEGIQEPEEQVATDVDEPEPDSNEMETDANEMENNQ